MPVKLNFKFIVIMLLAVHSYGQRVAHKEVLLPQATHHECCGDSIVRKDFHRCGSTLYRALEEKRNPEIIQERRKLEIQSQQWIKSYRTEPIIIPVVVHVVYHHERPDQNISEAQIISQIEALNRDFRRLNSDTVNTPEIFKGVAADAWIEFRLARRDPFGNPTNGITRTPTTVSSFTMEDDNVKYDSRGGKNIWSRDKYMNFWVCDLEAGLLGYAQYPGGFSQSDGIVISYRNFGTMGTVRTPYNQGRTVTHEVGHWLNLVHTWGDEDNCEATDFVEDTPNQETHYYRCPEFPQISCGTEDMFMNYMDYTDDHCMNIFTLGQKQRMHSTLNGFRAPIQRSDALNDPIDQHVYCEMYNTQLYSASLYNYRTSEGGYATGTNEYNDKAKAQFFANELQMTMVNGGEIAFGHAFDAGGSAYAAVWRADRNNNPIGIPLALKEIPLSEIVADIENFNFTTFSFDQPVSISGPFYMGVVLPATPQDTLAILASDVTSDVNAWELQSNNRWYNFLTSWEGSLNVNLAVFPHVCQYGQAPQQELIFSIGPNPVTDHSLNMYFSNYTVGDNIVVEMFDISGRRVLVTEETEIRPLLIYNLAHLQQTGLFIIRITGENINIRRKILVLNPQ
jgi:hypothetical protein